MSDARILYLEDDLDLGETTADFLNREGFSVEWIKNGSIALETFENKKFDLIVADIMMPQLDGYTFLKTIREKGNQIPFIYLSARVLTEDIVKGFSIGADDYIRKPFSLEELIARINRLLKNSNSVNSTYISNNVNKRLSVGSYYYDHTTYELSYENNTITLSHRLGEILYLLILTKDGVLPRKKTLIDLWGDDNFFNGRSLDVFIYKLRKHLSHDPTIKIMNIRGIGFKLITS